MRPTTPDLRVALRDRFASPEWALMFEVADATGAKQSRWADAVAINCYPSRGLEIHGFEIKVSRGDWQRELKAPDKSVPVQKYCDRWWIVAPTGIVHRDELPLTWGHLEYTEQGKLAQVVAAPVLPAEPVSRYFLASLLRNSDKANEADIAARIRKLTAEARAQDEKRIELEVERRTQKFTETRSRLAQIKALTGIDLLSWTPAEDIAACIKFAMRADVVGRHTSLDRLRNTLATAMKSIDEGMREAGLLPDESEKR